MFQELRFVGKIIKVTISRTAHMVCPYHRQRAEAVISTHPVIGIDVDQLPPGWHEI